MKLAQLPFAILFSSALHVSAQTNTFPTDGNVGIGTTGPASRLHVEGGREPRSFQTLFPTSYTTGTPVSGLRLSWYNDYWDLRAHRSNSTPIDAFTIAKNETEYFRITSNGLVGVGTATPQAKLHVANGSIFVGANTDLALELQENKLTLRSSGKDASGNYSVYSTEGWGWRIFGTNQQPTQILKSSLLVGYEAGGQAFGTGNAFMSGKLGIGTTNPYGRLHIQSSLDETAIAIGGPYDAGNYNSTPRGAAVGGYNIDFFGWRDVRQGLVGARIRAERMNWYQNNSALVQETDLAFYTSTGLEASSLTEKMRIGANGNVGIGTASPTEKLSVKGKIRAQEIKVESSNWPDYVFEPSYSRSSLSELEVFIKENRHLPEIPSAKEVGESGISLGEMNAKLLKKIEELTLYIIEQDKRIKKLEEKSD